jgi:hypothetical protein
VLEERLGSLGTGLLAEPDDVALHPGVAPDLLGAWEGGLLDGELGHPVPVVFDQLVHAVEVWSVRRYADLRTDPEGVDRRISQGGDDVLVESPAGEDLDLLQPGLVEQRAGVPGQSPEVPAVEPDRGQRVSFGLQLPGNLDGFLHTPHRVVGVDQKDHPVRIILRVGAEGFGFGVECLDVGVRHGAARAQPQEPGRLHVAGRGESHDRRGPGHGHTRFDAVHAAEREVDHALVRSGDAATGGLRRDGGLVRDLVEEIRLEELRLGERGRDLQERFVGEYQPALGDGPHVPGEPQLAEGVQGVVGVALGPAKVFQVLVGEAKRLQELQAMLEPTRHEESPTVRQIPHEQAESGGSGHVPPEVAGGHVQLVEVGEQGLSHRRPPGRPKHSGR